jgi:hypothetical protein
VSQLDLLSLLTPPCADCPNFGEPINSTGTAYCHALMVWQGPEDRVEGCTCRAKVATRWTSANVPRVDVLRDLLESPRHNHTPKGIKWLKAELRAELKAGASA